MPTSGTKRKFAKVQNVSGAGSDQPLLKRRRTKKLVFEALEKRGTKSQQVAALIIKKLFESKFSGVENGTGGSAGIVITGAGGTGKTFLINWVRSQCEANRINCKTAAFTNSACDVLGGDAQTIHSMFGIAVKKKENAATADRSKVEDDDSKEKPFESVDVVIIDEVSMVSKQMMDCIDRVLRLQKKRDELFGGVLMIIVGDLFQLPPVGKCDPITECDWWPSSVNNGVFFFVRLLENKRIESGTSSDAFNEFLLAVRSGQRNNAAMNIFQSRTCETCIADKLGPSERVIHLMYDNESVNKMNNEMRAAVDRSATANGAAPIIFKSKRNIVSARSDRLSVRGFATDEIVSFVTKVGDQVMVTRTIQARDTETGQITTVSAGELGMIEGVSRGLGATNDYAPHVRIYSRKSVFVIGRIKMATAKGKTVSVFPLKIAWATTVHQVQGITISRPVHVCIHMSRAMRLAPGCVYVAFSRIRDIGQLHICKNARDSEVRPWQDIDPWVMYITPSVL